ncbi:MAG: hypothetical protein HC813_03100 [Planctomycetes bacterium]|nr:hypothetical protein [Planctomycetota bacterium]
MQVKDGLRGWKFPDAAGSKTLDQIGCNYVPHVLGLRTNQDLLVRNSDPIMHNIHAFNLATGKDEFNFAQTQKGAESTRKFPRPCVLQIQVRRPRLDGFLRARREAPLPLRHR